MYHFSWLDAGEGDGKTERTLFPSGNPNQNNNNNQDTEIFVPLISPKPSFHEERSEQDVDEVKQEVEEEVTTIPTPEPKGYL